jgi:C2 domain-containing protein
MNLGYRGKKSIAPAADGTVAPAAKITRKTLDLRIEVLAAQNLPLPPDDEDPKGFKPYVKVELHVEGPDERISEEGQEKEGEYKARTKTARGRHPDFQGEVLKFSAIPEVVDQLAFVRFTVRDDEFGRDDLAAWACIRLDRLRSGYRFVHLNDCNGHLTDGAVLVRITKVLK